MRVLDELAEAFHVIRGSWQPRRVVPSLDLALHFTAPFSFPLSPVTWRQLGEELGCPLPPLAWRDERWALPDGWSSVIDLALFVAQRRDWLPPAGYSVTAWVEAQVFAGVRSVLVEALNVHKEEVVRPARLMADLGAA
jgi:hypothetical protein